MEDEQCRRCGSSTEFIECEACDEFGMDGHDCGEDTCCCMNPEDNIPCDRCGGKGGWRACVSTRAWCESHPLPGAA